MADFGCVTETDLRALLVGELPEPVTRAITLHLENCPFCEAAARQLDRLTDPFIRSMRQALQPGCQKASSAETLLRDTIPGEEGPKPVEQERKEGPSPSSQPRTWEAQPDVARPESGDHVTRSETCAPEAFRLTAPTGYTLLAELGRGGMSVVYRARQSRPERVVALKVLLGGNHASTERRLRFLAEADAIARLQHPGIVQVYEVGEHEGLPFLVLEYMAGGNLSQRLTGQPLPARQAAELVETLALAVEHAHIHGVIHRDLKPANILVSGRVVTGGVVMEEKDGPSGPTHDSRLATHQLKISDFGLAKQERPELTATGDVLGTPSYMAPEQARGAGARVGPAADIYALGAMLYEFLTGRPPFVGVSVLETLDQVRSREPVPPGRLNAGTPRNLETICLKCLEKEPARRYTSAGALAEDLRRFLADRPILARRSPLTERMWRWCRRNPWLAGLAASVLGLLVVVAIVSLIAAFRLERERNAVVRANNEATKNLWEAYLGQARAGRASGRPGQRVGSLRAVKNALELTPQEALSEENRLRLRNEAIACLARCDFWPGRICGGIDARMAVYRLDPAAEHYAYVEKVGAICIRRLTDDREIRRIPTEAHDVLGLRFSPDGRFLAAGLAPADLLQIWDTANGQRLFPKPLAANTLAFSPDSRRFVCGSAEGTVILHELPSGKQVSRLQAGGSIYHLAINRDGRQLAVCAAGRPAAVQVWEIESASVAKELQFGSSVRSLAFHPDGRNLAVGLGEGRAEIWDVATRQLRAAMAGHHQDVVELAFHPTGELLATRSDDNHTRLWHAGTGRLLVDWPSPVRSLGFSQDGRVLGTFLEGGRVRLAEVTAGREYRTLVSSRGAGQGTYFEPDISPDGRLLAVGMGDGARLWDLSSEREVAFLPIGYTFSAIFHPNGRELITAGDGVLSRWPIATGVASDMVMGPPRTVPLPVRPSQIRIDRDGQTLVVGGESDQNAILVDMNTERVVTRFAPHASGRQVALSRDGRWVATSGWYATSVKLWDARTRSLSRDLALGPQTFADFCPDSKTLITSRSDEYCFWDMESGTLIRRLPMEIPYYPNLVAFSPDQRVMALELAPGVISLLDVTTLRPLAKLEDPTYDRAHFMRFGPDGTSLVTVSYYGRAIHIWDLSAIGEQLAAMGLAWDEPLDSLASGRWRNAIATQHGSPLALRPSPLRIVRVNQGDATVSGAPSVDRARRTIQNFRSAHKANPENATNCNNLAWALATAPEALRKCEEALRLAEKAARLQPGNAIFSNTLGIAHYRCGHFSEAIAALEPNLRNQGDADLPFDLYFLAMSYHRLGETAHAQDLFIWAKRWSESHDRPGVLTSDQIAELAAFRAEAEELIGK
jgi:eukaryotic-like serine/threonine-protein kinase